jgi:hypothetical protein
MTSGRAYAELAKVNQRAKKASFSVFRDTIFHFLEKKLGRCLLLTINERNIAAFLVHGSLYE